MEDQDKQPQGAVATWSGPILIRPDRVFDGVALREGVQVLVEGGKISAVGTHVDPSGQISTLDGTGATLIPGLIDAHAHVSPGRLEQSLAFGVTTVLDMLSDPTAARQLKADAERAPARMASLYSSGTGATAPGCWPWGLVEAGIMPAFPTLRHVDEVDDFVASRIAEGSDYIKIFSASKPIRDDYLAPDIAAAPSGTRLAEIAAEHNVFVVPTIGVSAGILGNSRGPAVRDDPLLSPFLDDMARTFLSIERTTSYASEDHNLAHLLTTVSDFNLAGVRLLVGTDATNPGVAHGASLHDEMLLMTQAGLKPIQALTAATFAPAASFGLSDRGRIEPGRRADLLLVEGDPTSDITKTRHIREIWHKGVRVNRTARRPTPEVNQQQPTTAIPE